MPGYLEPDEELDATKKRKREDDSSQSSKAIKNDFGHRVERQYVIKRDGTREFMYFDQITKRIDWCVNLEPVLTYVDPILITQKVVAGAYSGIHTTELDKLAAETAASLTTHHPEYSVLAARIVVSNLHRQTSDKFSEVMEEEFRYRSPKTIQTAPLIPKEEFQKIRSNMTAFNPSALDELEKRLTEVSEENSSPLVSKELIDFVRLHRDRIESAIDYSRDYLRDYFGFKTLEHAYLVKLKGKTVERPQHMYMRIAIGIHLDSIDEAIETYHALSLGIISHATPTMFNSGTPKPSLASCYLLTMKEDSIEGIYETLKQCAILSKHAGGIGLNISRIRCAKSHIRGTNGTSSGIVPMLRNFNETARYVDQGGNKRKGSFAIYLEPWHDDFLDFADLKKQIAKAERQCLDLFFGAWIPDLFMRRVESKGQWSFFCPNEAPGLSEVWGAAFDSLYETYEKNPLLVRRTMNAADVMAKIIESQIETGSPYMLYKDACNRRSNMQHLGTIRGSNLCCEIIQYTSAEEVAVCNLASLALPKMLVGEGENRRFDFNMLHKYVKMMTRNLDKTIDRNFYPIPETRVSNLRHRPIGMGVQGQANLYFALNLPFESNEAARLNEEIFETMYHAFLEQSCELAAVHGPHESYPGSPMSKGVLQFDFDGHAPASEREGSDAFHRWNWTPLRENIKKYGVRNIHGIAPMPTATTAQILGNNETFEPITSLIYTRAVLSGEFTMVCSELVKDLIALDLWSLEMKNQIIANDGSIANIAVIPESLRAKYKTVWEMSQRTLIDMAAARSPYIDQSQSFNIFIAEPTFRQIYAMHMYGWRKGLKTGMYYLRTNPKVKATKVTLEAKASVVSVPRATPSTTLEPALPPVDETMTEEDRLKKANSRYADCNSCGA